MKITLQVFSTLPDIIIFTDAHWYILDFNRAGPFHKLKKGEKLSRFIPDCENMKNGTWRQSGKTFLRTVSPLYEKGHHAGYTVFLVDVSEKMELVRQSREKGRTLESLMRIRQKRKEELEQITRQAESLSDYSEQVRIARFIHDGAGHAVTAVHAISQMCIACREKDPAQYQELLEAGINICKQGGYRPDFRAPRSLADLLDHFRMQNPFPVLLDIRGEEPSFAPRLYDIIFRVCKEAYHNTLSHSLADALEISLVMEPEALTIHITDNGSFRGVLVKGYGLTNMENAVLSSGGSIVFTALPGKGFGIDISWRIGNV